MAKKAANGKSPEKTNPTTILNALKAANGILRLAPTWVPRSFLTPGRRLKLHPDDLYAFGAQPRRHRRALVRLHHAGRQRRRDCRTKGSATSSTTASRRSRSRDAIEPRRRDAHRRRRSGSKYKQLAGLLASSSTTWGRSRITCTRTTSRPSSSASKASRSPTTSRRSSTTSATTSPTRSWASSPARPRRDVRQCLENWNKGDNGILDLRKAYRLKPGTGWLVAAVRPARSGFARAPTSRSGAATSSACTSRWSKAATCRGRCSSRTCPKEKHKDLDFIVDQLDWEGNVDPELQGQPLPRADRRRRRRRQGLRRPLDRLRQGRRRAALHRQGADRRARREGHDQGQRRLRPDRACRAAARSTASTPADARR